MKKLILSLFFIFSLSLNISAKDYEPLTLGLWSFRIYVNNKFFKYTTVCVDYKRFWRITKLKRVKGCKVRLVTNKKRKKVWFVKCKFKNAYSYKGYVTYAYNRFIQNYTINVKGKRVKYKILGKLRRKEICPISRVTRVSKVVPAFGPFSITGFGE
jgi:hypothetical protein